MSNHPSIPLMMLGNASYVQSFVQSIRFGKPTCKNGACYIPVTVKPKNELPHQPSKKDTSSKKDTPVKNKNEANKKDRHTAKHAHKNKKGKYIKTGAKREYAGAKKMDQVDQVEQVIGVPVPADTIRQKRSNRRKKRVASRLTNIPTEIWRTPDWKMARKNFVTIDDMYEVEHMIKRDQEIFEDIVDRLNRLDDEMIEHCKQRDDDDFYQQQDGQQQQAKPVFSNYFDYYGNKLNNTDSDNECCARGDYADSYSYELDNARQSGLDTDLAAWHLW